MFTLKSLLAYTTLALGLGAQVASAHFSGSDDACPGFTFLIPRDHHCVCEEAFGGYVPFKRGCGATWKKFYGVPYCTPWCHHGSHPSQRPKARRSEGRRQIEQSDLSPPDDIDMETITPCSAHKGASTACPVFSSDAKRLAEEADDFECVDSSQDVKNCGGCSSLDVKYSCIDIPFSGKTTCERGRCKVWTCKTGYTPGVHAETGLEACIKV